MHVCAYACVISDEWLVTCEKANWVSQIEFVVFSWYTTILYMSIEMKVWFWSFSKLHVSILVCVIAVRQNSLLKQCQVVKPMCKEMKVWCTYTNIHLHIILMYEYNHSQ